LSILNKTALQSTLTEVIKDTPITDIHTHLFTENFGELVLWGIDELLTYHYLVAETFRYYPDLAFSTFWAMSKREQADLVWQTLFIDHSPYSEACRGVLTVLSRLGLDVGARDLQAYRQYFEQISLADYMNTIFKLAGVSSVCMTNDPFVEKERVIWESNPVVDARYHKALRIDPLLNQWSTSWKKLKGWGFEVEEAFSEKTIEGVKSFLRYWINLINPLYIAASLPPSFIYPEDSARGRMLDECVLPVAREFNLPFAMMIGVKKQVNPSLGDAGDSVDKSNVSAVENICRLNLTNKFLCTMLSREDQHSLTVTARKFRNLHIFGCWWFLNNPSIIEEMTRMRLEMLGSSMTPQHSDCRVLDQMLYKWDHFRKIANKVLFDKYSDIMDTGWKVTEAEIRRDVADLFGESFWRFLERRPE
jgi:hypothetical protein